MYKEIKTDEQIDALVLIARDIWMEHFQFLLGKNNIEKIISLTQSKPAIIDQLSKDYKYYFILEKNEKLGYFAYHVDTIGKELFLSKLYVYSNHRGKGVGRKVVNYLLDFCVKQGLEKIYLDVYHKNESSIAAYKKMGFSIDKKKVKKFDSKLSFIDYQMSKLLNN
jgi:ribosomal protein S18 acetylase RimI-like enzyme